MKSKKILSKFMLVLGASAFVIPTITSLNTNSSLTVKSINHNLKDEIEYEIDATEIGADEGSGIVLISQDSDKTDSWALSGIQYSTFKASNKLNFGNGKVKYIDDDGKEQTATITSIRDYLFQNINIEGKVVIPHTITTIGSHAFDGAFTNIETTNTLTIPSSITNIGCAAFKNSYVSDVYFEQDNIEEINKMVFANGTSEEYSSWVPTLTEGSYYWFPYSSETEEVREDGVTYNVTKVMKAYHDLKGFNIKYASMRNGKPISAPSVDTTKIECDVWESVAIKATIADGVDIYSPDNKITWTSNNENIKFANDEYSSTWANSLVTKGTKEHVVYVLTNTNVTDATITLTVTDNHKNEYKTEIAYSSDYDPITEFKFNDGEEEIVIKPNEAVEKWYSIFEDSKNLRHIAGVDFDITNFKKDGVAIEIPSWFELGLNQVLSPNIENAKLYSTFINIAEECEEGVYTFDIVACTHNSNRSVQNKTVSKSIKLTISNSPTPPTPPTPTPDKKSSNWWVWLLVGISCVTIAGLVTWYILKLEKNKKNKNNQEKK